MSAAAYSPPARPPADPDPSSVRAAPANLPVLTAAAATRKAARSHKSHPSQRTYHCSLRESVRLRVGARPAVSMMIPLARSRPHAEPTRCARGWWFSRLDAARAHARARARRIHYQHTHPRPPAGSLYTLHGPRAFHAQLIPPSAQLAYLSTVTAHTFRCASSPFYSIPSPFRSVPFLALAPISPRVLAAATRGRAGSVLRPAAIHPAS
ncbi:hypothetical protein B0H17DRAFT_1101367 [Mycena rosella]|uniref:Uncharacterized protein n=1 Tax=Mycena rosella TaxID=1033263 RepID=A0AAD7CLX3_MYCRO|nr:hypothetical protein B0H17DRAFT_1101367 [Mycena rosella]